MSTACDPRVDAFPLDYCARWGIGVVHCSEVGLIGGLDRAHLRRVRRHADALGLEIGMLSIAPGSTIFGRGSAEAQLVALFEAARIVGSPIVRCVLGLRGSHGPGGMEQRIDEAVRVLRNVRTRAGDAGVKSGRAARDLAHVEASPRGRGMRSRWMRRTDTDAGLRLARCTWFLLQPTERPR